MRCICGFGRPGILGIEVPLAVVVLVELGFESIVISLVSSSDSSSSLSSEDEPEDEV
jgi:hypothetical protein